MKFRKILSGMGVWKNTSEIEIGINKYKLSGKFKFDTSNNIMEKFIIKVKDGNIINEAVDYEFESNKKGGIIIFSVDVNATIQDKNGFLGKIKTFLLRKIESLKNKIFFNKKINKIISSQDSEDFVGASIGNFFLGKYKAKDGSIYDENSISIEIIGIDTALLNKIASEIAREFNQETVLVKNYTTNTIYLANAL